MSRRSRPSTSTRTRATIALALLGLLGGIAVYRSQRAAPTQSVPPRSPHALAPGETRSSAPPAPSAAAVPRTPVASRAADGADASVATPTLPSGVRSRSDDPSADVELIVPPQGRGLVRISGVPSGQLAPGLSARVDLVLTNPNVFPITVGSLSVRVRTIHAPRADSGHTCGAQDFTVAQFAGRALRLGPRSTTALGRLGIDPARWPRVSMLDRRVNQDGCKGASLALDYRGLGRR